MIGIRSGIFVQTQDTNALLIYQNQNWITFHLCPCLTYYEVWWNCIYSWSIAIFEIVKNTVLQQHLLGDIYPNLTIIKLYQCLNESEAFVFLINTDSPENPFLKGVKSHIEPKAYKSLENQKMTFFTNILCSFIEKSKNDK